jgi:SnoaL-like domain
VVTVQLDPAVERELLQLSYRYAAGIDHRDWALYRSIFADMCTFDFSSWSGRPSAEMSADEWVQAVRSVNGNFDATQHIMTNHRFESIDADTVIGVNELQAQHWFTAVSMVSFGRAAEAAWCLLGGHYTNRYVRTDDGWRIDSCQLDVRWRTGDESIFTFARRRST